MPAPNALSETELETITDPDFLLHRARALEPALRLTERAAALARLKRLLDSGQAPPSPPGRDWRLELIAERAIDETSLVRLDSAAELSDQVLREADPGSGIAILRALMARARQLAWTGTERATSHADAVFLEAITLARDLEQSEWLGHLMFWRAHTVFFQTGQITRAAEQMRDALAVLGEESPRRSTVLTFYADVLIALGEWDEAGEALDEARTLADRDQDDKSRAYAAWSRAHMTSVHGDGLTTERLLREVERESGDWFEMDTGITFLADAAEMMDRVGLTAQATEYLQRATARDPDDEFVRQARATLLARSGDPQEGLDALQGLARGEWLEKRLLWRHILLTAWASFRSGRGDPGQLTARALEQSLDNGGLRVAEAGEPDIVRALAPMAAQAGSAPARELMLAGRPFLVRLFGKPSVTRADGTVVSLPAGKPGELVRMLALHEHGLPVDVVLERFFPDTAAATGRHRLRQILLRVRAEAADLIIREADQVRLADAWVDVREFLAIADRVQAAPGTRSIQLAYAALAVYSGPLLPFDEYVDWAYDAREHVEYRYVSLLDLIASDAAQRGSHQEALTALDAILRLGHHDAEHVASLREHLLALGRHQTASFLEQSRLA